MNKGSDVLAQALGTFMEEAGELLAQMEEILLRAEECACGEDDLNALFRCAHTIKGSGGLFGLDEVVRFTHVVENVLDRLRRGEMHFDSELISLLLECQDQISHLIAAISENAEVPVARSDELLARLQAVLGTAVATTASVPASTAPADAAPEITASGGGALGSDHWHLSLRFGPKVLQDGMDPLAFINYLTQYGTLVHVETIIDDLPPFADADPELFYLGFEVALRSTASKAEIEGVFEFIAEDATIVILPPHSRISEFIALIDAQKGDVTRIGELLVACGSVTAKELAEALAEQRCGP